MTGKDPRLPTRTPRKLGTAALALAAGLLLSACSGEETARTGTNAPAGAAAVDAGALAEMIAEVEEGASRLRLSGAVEDTGTFTTGEAGRYAGTARDVFRPAQGGRGDQVRRGSNADGPHMFVVYTDAIHQEDEDDVVRAWINVTLPDGAGPGTYAVAALRDAADDEAQASIAGDGYAWRFGRRVEGTLYIAEIGERLTAAWDFAASEGEDRAHATGAVRGLPFSPQPEARFTLSADGETVEHFGRLAAQRRGNGGFMLVLGRTIYLELPPDIDEGVHAIRTRREAPGDVTLTLPDYGIAEADGELALERRDGFFHGRFEITASGEQDVAIGGTLGYVDLGGR